jgi:hypothetical protein
VDAFECVSTIRLLLLYCVQHVYCFTQYQMLMVHWLCNNVLDKYKRINYHQIQPVPSICMCVRLHAKHCSKRVFHQPESSNGGQNVSPGVHIFCSMYRIYYILVIVTDELTKTKVFTMLFGVRYIKRSMCSILNNEYIHSMTLLYNIYYCICSCSCSCCL